MRSPICSLRVCARSDQRASAAASTPSSRATQAIMGAAGRSSARAHGWDGARRTAAAGRGRAGCARPACRGADQDPARSVCSGEPGPAPPLAGPSPRPRPHRSTAAVSPQPVPSRPAFPSGRCGVRQTFLSRPRAQCPLRLDGHRRRPAHRLRRDTRHHRRPSCRSARPRRPAHRGLVPAILLLLVVAKRLKRSLHRGPSCSPPRTGRGSCARNRRSRRSIAPATEGSATSSARIGATASPRLGAPPRAALPSATEAYAECAAQNARICFASVRSPPDAAGGEGA